jgi:alpha-galactosidase
MAWRAESDGAGGFSLTETALDVGLLGCRLAVEPAAGEGAAAPVVLQAAPAEGGALRLCGRTGGLVVTLTAAGGAERGVVRGELRNEGAEREPLGALRLDVGTLRLPGERFRFLKNGYQSWTQARSYGPADAERVPNLAFARRMQDDLGNLASGAPGDLRGSSWGVLGALDTRRFLVVGQGPGWSQWLQLRVRFAAPARPPVLTLALDFGGQALPPGAAAPLDELHVVARDHANRALDAYLDGVAVPAARREDDPPVGWCSWYYHYTKVTAADVRESLQAATARGVDWPLFQLDDGYQTAVGDWLSINGKFPGGLRPLVQRIEAAGRRAGLWLAPFCATRDARVFRDHPDWWLRDDRGRPLSAGWNPLWRLASPGLGRMVALDTTHPDARAWLRDVVRTMVRDWGFRYLKLDFLYAAALRGRAHDETVSPAGRLRLGLRAIRDAAGPDVFLLGCGAPLSASVGLVDGMRIGPDVAPFWFPSARYHLTRDPHALSAAFAVRNLLVRAQLHRRLWENDPDCLLIRDRKTRLDAVERATLANAIAISGGMFLLSDRLATLPEAAWQTAARVADVVRACARGRCWPLDVMERELPELVWNTAGWLAVFNFGEQPVRKRVALADHLAAVLPEGATTFEEPETGRTHRVADGALDLGELPRHGSKLLRLAGAADGR